MNQIQLNYENKIDLFFLCIGLVSSAYGFYLIFQLLILHSEDVNFFAAVISLLLLQMIAVLCSFLIYNLISKASIKINNGDKGN